MNTFLASWWIIDLFLEDCRGVHKKFDKLTAAILSSSSLRISKVLTGCPQVQNMSFSNITIQYNKYNNDPISVYEISLQKTPRLHLLQPKVLASWIWNSWWAFVVFAWVLVKLSNDRLTSFGFQVRWVLTLSALNVIIELHNNIKFFISIDQQWHYKTANMIIFLAYEKKKWIITTMISASSWILTRSILKFKKDWKKEVRIKVHPSEKQVSTKKLYALHNVFLFERILKSQKFYSYFRLPI